MAYCFDVPVRYVAAMEIPDPFDHVYKLHAEKVESEPHAWRWGDVQAYQV